LQSAKIERFNGDSRSIKLTYFSSNPEMIKPTEVRLFEEWFTVVPDIHVVVVKSATKRFEAAFIIAPDDSGGSSVTLVLKASVFRLGLPSFVYSLVYARPQFIYLFIDII
jgi:hypothetical protein